MYDLIRRVFPGLLMACLAGAGTARAQAAAAPVPAAPPAPWTGSAGFGLTVSRGNTATTNLNASFEATHDPKTASVWKFKGLYLRGTNNEVLAVDRLSLEGRNERTLGARVYAFANLQFLEDQFKEIDYLVAPSGGVGYKLIATPLTTFNVDGGLGVKVEKNIGLDRRTDVVVTSSEKFEHKVSTTAALTQSFGAIWKAKDFGDALYTFTAGAAAALTARTQLKVELLDSYASRPPSAAVQSNDVAVVTALVYKF
jgi:putative salt-induced outer membrane protein YdiY